MSAPKQPSPNEGDGDQETAATPQQMVENLVSRLTLETRLHADLQKSHDEMIESSEDCIKSLQEEIVSLEENHSHELGKLQDIINGLSIKCEFLEKKRDVSESVEELSWLKIKDLHALEDEIELREEAFYSRQSKAYRKATQKYQDSVTETSQSIAQEAVLAYLETHAVTQSKESKSGDKGKLFKPHSTHSHETKVAIHRMSVLSHFLTHICRNMAGTTLRIF